ncbi:MAG: hypothetical protein ACRCST_06460 [Turicibacter sp.]
MDIIKKYKKIFIGVAVVALLVGLIPVLGFTMFFSVMTSSEVVTITENVVTGPSDIVVKTPTIYQPLELVMDSEVNLPNPTYVDGMETTKYERNFTKETTEEEVLYEAYLEEGTCLDMTYSMRIPKDSYLDFHLIDETGSLYSFSGLAGKEDKTKYIVEKSGNYGLVYQSNNVKGSFKLILNVKEPVSE